ncbi:hypothetical protein [Rhizosaccharibacter radicis]|uniref:DUF2868 domain-containing protein n=1 Tax=Rhizosaccharibacter radicis TaxID=2782605 RepID=A0ABT1VV85_9PROT|nr:hypothetical protein [Acetobacteraceae bacterium KSS12]
MPGGSFLDAIIGLALTYLVLAMSVSAIQEALSGLLQWRARTLAQGLRCLLQAVPPSEHPNLLQAATAWVLRGPRLPVPPNGPADPAERAHLEALYQTLVTHPLVSAAGRMPSYIPSDGFATALLDTLGALAAVPAELHDRIDALPDGRLKQALLTLSREAGHDVTVLREGLAHWFDHAMDQLSGVYRRWSAVLSFVLALLVTMLLNASTVGILRDLLGANGHAAALADAFAGGAIPDTVALGLIADPGYWLHGWHGAFWPHMLDLAGCLITAFAVSLGAPFWFGILGAASDIRSAEPKPKKAPRAT